MAISIPQTRLVTERRFFTTMALAMATATFVGFAPTYFLAAWNDAPTPVLTPSIHIHGALCAAWIALLAVQTGLIAARRPDIHLVALVIYDLRTRGRLHPATLWGGGFLLVSQPLRVMIAYSQPWQDFARMLMT